MEVLKKKVLKHIKHTSDKLDMQLGFAFLDNKTLKKLGVTKKDLIVMFGESKIEPTETNIGVNIHWK